MLAKGVRTTRVPLKYFVFASITISVVGIALVLLLQKNLPPEVPLFYGLPEGDEQLTSTIKLIIPFIGALIITTINTTLVFFLQNSFLQKTLVLTSFAISILSFITIMKIILLVGSF